MKTFLKISLAIISCLVIQTNCNAQLNTKRIETKQFRQKNDAVHYKYVEMDFNSFSIENNLNDIDANEVQSISLVYTMYKQSVRFNQLSLNTSRIDRLLKAFPKFKNPTIKWYWVAQTGCKSPEACNDFFHGFEIRLKTTAEITSAKTAETLLDYYIKSFKVGNDSKSLDSLLETETSTLIKVCDTIVKERVYHSRIGSLNIKRQNSEKTFLKELRRYRIQPESTVVIQTDQSNRIKSVTGIKPESLRTFKALIKRYYRFKVSRFEGKPTSTEFELHFQSTRGKSFNALEIMVTVLNKDSRAITNFEDKKVITKSIKCYYTDTSMSEVYGVAPNDVVTEVLERNPQWKNCIVATDVTGSMYPYLAQFIVWHEKNLDKRKGNHDFVFFNDGDNLPDNLKETGAVGGTYFRQTAQYDSLKKTMVQAMTNGFGGDGPENNIEAILYGLKNNPRCKEVIMIADNWATPRDMDLLKKVKVPVHIILCGGSKGMNMEYIKIAKETKGSIHTIEHDLYNLDRINFTETGQWVTVKN